jgi:hypothetical protein
MAGTSSTPFGGLWMEVISATCRGSPTATPPSGFVHELRFWLAFRDVRTLSDG